MLVTTCVLVTVAFAGQPGGGNRGGNRGGAAGGGNNMGDNRGGAGAGNNMGGNRGGAGAGNNMGGNRGGAGAGQIGQFIQGAIGAAAQNPDVRFQMAARMLGDLPEVKALVEQKERADRARIALEDELFAKNELLIDVNKKLLDARDAYFKLLNSDEEFAQIKKELDELTLALAARPAQGAPADPAQMRANMTRRQELLTQLRERAAAIPGIKEAKEALDVAAKNYEETRDKVFAEDAKWLDIKILIESIIADVETMALLRTPPARPQRNNANNNPVPAAPLPAEQF